MLKDQAAKLRDIEGAIAQGESFMRLSASPEWPVFRAWLDRAADLYERQVHSSQNRESGVALARYLEGHAAITNLLNNFDKSITQLPKLRQDRQDIESGTTSQPR